MSLFPKITTSDSHSEQQQSVTAASQQSVQQSVQQPAQPPAQPGQNSTTNKKRGFFGMFSFIHSFQGRRVNKKKELPVIFYSYYNI